MEKSMVENQNNNMEERKFTDAELHDIVKTNLVYPENHQELGKNLKDYFIKLGVKIDEHGLFSDDQANNTVPEEYWFTACDLAITLAEALLRERSDDFHDLKSEVDDIESSLKQIRKKLNSRTKN